MRVFTLALAFVLMVPGAAWAADLLYASSGRGFTAGRYFGQVVTYDISLGTASAIQNSAKILNGPNLYEPMGVAFDATGKFYVADTQPSGPYAVYKIDTSEGGYNTFASPAPVEPKGIAFDSAGNLYVANGSGISKFDSSGALVSGFGSALSPWGITFDSFGNLYAAEFDANSVSKFDPSGALVWRISTNINRPRDVAVDSSGTLYVTNLGSGTITKYNSSGVFLTSFSGFTGGMSFDSAGNLYVASGSTVAGTNSKIAKYNSSGVFQFSWDAGIPTGIPTGPRFMAIQPVPEPSTYILGTIAALTFTILARRRRRTALA